MAYSQATQVAAVPAAKVEIIRLATEEEYMAILIEPGVAADVGLANVIYFNPEAGDIEIPAIEQDEIMK